MGYFELIIKAVIGTILFLSTLLVIFIFWFFLIIIININIEHKSNSSVGNKWIHQETRINQLKYYNEVRQHQINFRIDGLNTLMYDLKAEKNVSSRVKQISVELW